MIKSDPVGIIGEVLDRWLKQTAPIPLSSIAPDTHLMDASSVHNNNQPRKIKFIRRGELTIQEYAPGDFEVAAGHNYTPELLFAEERTYHRLRKQCEYVLKKGALTTEMKWLGVFYAEQIRSHSVAEVSIRWIDENLGYGLFAEENIEAGEYIGEYTGIVRKRNLLFQNSNDYCFSYPTSDVNFRKHMIDAKDNGNELRYANHSEEPNCEARCVLLDDILHIIIRAISNIPVNAQITYDYSPDYWTRRTSVPN